MFVTAQHVVIAITTRLHPGTTNHPRSKLRSSIASRYPRERTLGQVIQLQSDSNLQLVSESSSKSVKLKYMVIVTCLFSAPCEEDEEINDIDRPLTRGFL